MTKIIQRVSDEGTGVRASISFDFYAGSHDIVSAIEEQILYLIGTANVINTAPDPWQKPNAQVKGTCSRHEDNDPHTKGQTCIDWKPLSDTSWAKDASNPHLCTNDACRVLEYQTIGEVTRCPSCRSKGEPV